MAENIEEKIKSYRTAPFDARFPNTNQTRNCFQNYLGEDMDQRVMFDYPFYILDNCSDVWQVPQLRDAWFRVTTLCSYVIS